MRIAVAMLLLSGCAITEDNLPERYAGTFCDRLEECERGEFEDEFGDMDTCEAEVTETVEDVVALFELLDCELNGSAAKDEIQAMRRATCGEFVDGEWDGGGEAVWDCP